MGGEGKKAVVRDLDEILMANTSGTVSAILAPVLFYAIESWKHGRITAKGER
jgi:hypothetical protein